MAGFWYGILLILDMGSLSSIPMSRIYHPLILMFVLFMALEIDPRHGMNFTVSSIKVTYSKYLLIAYGIHTLLKSYIIREDGVGLFLLLYDPL